MTAAPFTAPSGAAAAAAAPSSARLELLAALALLHAEHGQPERGLTYALLAEAFAPAAPLARRMLAFCLLKTGAAREALETIQPLADAAHPPQPDLELLRAEALRALGRRDEAAAAFWRSRSRAAGAEALSASERSA